jgi:hypothetical protein
MAEQAEAEVPVEASSVASGVDTPGTEAPTNQDNAGNEQQPEAPKPEPYSRQKMVLQRQQAEIRKEREAAKAEREAIQAEKQEVAQLKQWQEALASGNPMPFLRENKLSLEDIYQMFAAEEKDPNVVAQKATKELDEKWQAKFDAMEAEKQRQAEAALEADIQHKQGYVTKQIEAFIQAQPERYELIANIENPTDLVLETIKQAYLASDEQTVLTYEQAADAVESYLEEQELKSNKLFKTGKAKKYLQEITEADVVTKERKKSADQPGRSKQASRAHSSKPEPRTLSAKMTGPTAGAVPNKETWEQKKERLFRELEQGTYRPSL